MTYAQSFVAVDRSTDVVRIWSRRIAAKLLETVPVFQRLCHRLHCIALSGSEHHGETILKKLYGQVRPVVRRNESTARDYADVKTACTSMLALARMNSLSLREEYI